MRLIYSNSTFRSVECDGFEHRVDGLVSLRLIVFAAKEVFKQAHIKRTYIDRLKGQSSIIEAVCREVGKTHVSENQLVCTGFG